MSLAALASTTPLPSTPLTSPETEPNFPESQEDPVQRSLNGLKEKGPNELTLEELEETKKEFVTSIDAQTYNVIVYLRTTKIQSMDQLVYSDSVFKNAQIKIQELIEILKRSLDQRNAASPLCGLAKRQVHHYSYSLMQYGSIAAGAAESLYSGSPYVLCALALFSGGLGLIKESVTRKERDITGLTALINQLFEKSLSISSCKQAIMEAAKGSENHEQQKKLYKKIQKLPAPFRDYLTNMGTVRQIIDRERKIPVSGPPAILNAGDSSSEESKSTPMSDVRSLVQIVQSQYSQGNNPPRRIREGANPNTPEPSIARRVYRKTLTPANMTPNSEERHLGLPHEETPDHSALVLENQGPTQPPSQSPYNEGHRLGLRGGSAMSRVEAVRRELRSLEPSLHHTPPADGRRVTFLPRETARASVEAPHQEEVHIKIQEASVEDDSPPTVTWHGEENA